MRRRLAWWPVALFWLAGASALLAGAYTKTVEKTFTVGEEGDLSLRNTNGAVVVESWERDEIWVQAVKRVRAGSRREAEEMFERVEVKMQKEGDMVQVETRLPHSSSGLWAALFGHGNSASVSYHLKVPARTHLDIETVNGKVITSDVSGRLQFKTTNGAIKIRDAGGQIEAKTTNGSIEAELSQVDERAELIFRTTNGSLAVTLPQDVRADVDARTTNGSVRSDFDVDGTRSRGKLRGRINGGGCHLVLHTTNGGIRIRER